MWSSFCGLHPHKAKSNCISSNHHAEFVFCISRKHGMRDFNQSTLTPNNFPFYNVLYFLTLVIF